MSTINEGLKQILSAVPQTLVHKMAEIDKKKNKWLSPCHLVTWGIQHKVAVEYSNIELI